jgi:hypothetical protein
MSNAPCVLNAPLVFTLRLDSFQTAALEEISPVFTIVNIHQQFIIVSILSVPTQNMQINALLFCHLQKIFNTW